jgi:hypothetical protein
MNAKLIKRIIWLIFFGLGIGLIQIVSVSSAQENDSVGSVLLQQQTHIKKIGDYEKQKYLTETNSWKEFVQKNGNWTVQWNEATQTPHRAFGPAIQIDGYTQLNGENVRDAAISFLEKNKSLFKVDVKNIKLIKATHVRDKWYVSFIQMHRGIEVLLSEIELRISDNAKIISFGANFYNNINLFSIPAFSFESVKLNAVKNLTFNSDTDKIERDGKLYYLPIIKSNKATYVLVYKAVVKTKDPPAHYICYIDANNDLLRWRYNRINNFLSGTGIVKGLVQLNSPSGPFMEKNFKNLTVKLGNEEVTSDADGKISLNNTGEMTLAAELKGPYVEVRRGDAENAKITKTITENENFSLLWDDNNSCAAERDIFYHINIAHDYIKSINPDFTGMDYPISLAVNVESGAFNTENGLLFFHSGNVNSEVTCENFARKAEIIYHEYGHAVNEKIYYEAAYAILKNMAASEAMADVFAAFILDEHRVGLNLFDPQTIIRDLKSHYRYPENVFIGPHHDGMVLSGAFWDLRELIGLEAARKLSHYALWGTPDDPNVDVAFSELYVETLIADDDDDNLGNGTPHFNEITEAFNNHGIGSNLFISSSFSITDVEDKPSSASSYTVNFKPCKDVTGKLPQNIELIYSTDGFYSSRSVNAQVSGNKRCTVTIPKVKNGTLVQFYISAEHASIGNIIKFPEGAPQVNVYSFTVGYGIKISDNFENDSGWIVGVKTDKATKGRWQRLPPEKMINRYEVVIIPDEDHSPNGQSCFLTPTEYGNMDIITVDGITTLTSPFFDLSGMHRPLPRYYLWIVRYGKSSLKTEVSDDGGALWNILKIDTTNIAGKWIKYDIPLESAIRMTNNVKFRFIADPKLVEACFRRKPEFFAVLLDDFQILDTDAVSASAAENISQINRPEKFALHNNFPNPFNSETIIHYDLPQVTDVSLIIYSTLGQEIIRLAGGRQAAGIKMIKWNGKNRFSKPVPSGISFCRLQAGKFNSVKKNDSAAIIN